MNEEIKTGTQLFGLIHDHLWTEKMDKLRQKLEELPLLVRDLTKRIEKLEAFFDSMQKIHEETQRKEETDDLEC